MSIILTTCLYGVYPSLHLTMSAVASPASSAAEALISARVVSGTKAAYVRNITVIEKYFTTELHHAAFTVPVQLPDILSFSGWLINTHFKEKNAAISTIRLYKSALLWYYKEQKLIVHSLVNQGIETLLKGYQLRVADRKSRGEMPTFEGKYHLTYDGYCLLATALFKMEPFNQMLFGWPFLVLQWNLIATSRSATVDAMMMEHVSWEANSLLISTPQSKSDQEGEKCFARHLYANPLNPIICPVLALAVLVFTRIAKHDPAHSRSWLCTAQLQNF